MSTQVDRVGMARGELQAFRAQLRDTHSLGIAIDRLLAHDAASTELDVELREARDAMAELMGSGQQALYDMREVRDRYKSLIAVELGERLEESIDRLAASLARVGGAA